MKTELLAPAKNKETAFAAIDCGADAVYIGASAFAVKQNSGNSIEDIEEVVEYAHKFYAKVFVTVNTILSDNELEQAEKLVIKLNKIGVDAILIQDMGLLEKIINLQENDKNFDIPIHMSTQCDNRDIEKIKYFNNIGVSRVVLARELSLKQIKKIHEANPNLELEAFIHGALCVSYSGQCYLSQYIGGRSANRGECAQPCRKNYSVITDNGEYLAKNIPALCLKDFNASKHIKNMIDSGIYSFKIEGRLKDIGYVKNIVSYYRQELDKYSQKSSSGITHPSFTPNPEKSFNRGFTDYFLEKRGECYNFVSPKSKGEFLGTVSDSAKKITIKTKKNIHPQDGLCFETDIGLEGFLVNTAFKSSDNSYIVTPNRAVKIPKGAKIYRNVDVEFEKELLLPTKRQIRVDIVFEENKLTLKDEDGVCISIDINNIEKANNPEKMRETFIKQFSKTGESDFCIIDFKINSEIPFMPISEINKLRRDSFEKLAKERVLEYKRQVQKPITHKPYYKNKLDYKGNVYNNKAVEFYKKCDCSVEEYCPEHELPNHTIELMRTKHCLRYALKQCSKDTKTSYKQLFLVDEKGTKYPLKFDCKNCEMVVLSP